MKKILIVGAGFLQSFLIKKAKEIGLYVFAIDGDPNAVGFKFADYSACINIVDTKSALKFAQEKGIDGIVTAATDFGVITTSEVADRLGLPGVKPDVALLIKNKYQVRKCLYDNKVDDTRQAFEVTEETNLAELAPQLLFPVMVKPCDGSGSRGASRVDNISQLEEACRYAIEGSITHRAVIESFIVGNEYGVESFVENGEIHVLAVMRKWMTNPPYYAELGHAIPCGLPPETEKKVKFCAAKAIKAIGVNFGSVNMDVLVTDSGDVHIVDIGARMGGNLIGSHIIPIGTGIDYMANILNAAVGNPTDFNPSARHNIATKLLALTPGVIAELPDFDSIAKECNVIIEEHLSVGGEITTYRTNLDGCGYVVALSNATVTEAVDTAERARIMIDKSIKRE